MALYQRFRRQFLSRVGLVRWVVVLVGIVFLVVTWQLAIGPASRRVSSLWQAYNLDFPQHQGRTNFLMLGVAGGDHEGADLTDTIIFASVRHSDGKVVLLSIPRDIWVPSMKAKINTAYYYGEVRKEGGGFTLAKAAVSEIIDQPVHFVAKIDFANFEKIIDSLGGVEISVERAFDDYKFPIPGRENDECGGDPEYGCRYEHIHFDSGPQVMNGATALKYVRSRQAEGDEGSDFARSKRQEKLLLALKDKMLSRGVLTDPKKLSALYTSLGSALVTDMTPDQYPALVKLGLLSSKANQVETASLSEDNQLYHPLNSLPFQGQWVLLPKANDPDVIFNYVSGLLSR